MSLVENLETDIIDYAGEKCFQVVAEYISKNMCNILVQHTTLTRKI